MDVGQAMTEPDPTYHPNGEQLGQSDDEILALRSDLIRTVKALERVLEARRVPFERAVITRRERRDLTREVRKK